MSHSFKNIILFQNGSIGDFLMGVYLMENIHLSDNNLHLFIVVPRNKKIFSGLLKKYSYVNLLKANKKSLEILLGLRLVFGRNCVIIPPTIGKIPLSIKVAAKVLTLKSGDLLVGFKDRSGINKIYDLLLVYDTRISYLDTIKTILKKLNFNVVKQEPDFKFSPQKEISSEYGLEDNNFIVLHPFGSNEKRSIPKNDLAWLINKIRENFPRLKIVISGGKGEKKIIQDILGNSAGNENVLNIAGKVSLEELANIIDKSRLYVGVDTGVSHLASFLKKRSLVIANNGTANWLPYYNKNAEIIYKIAGSNEEIYDGKDYLDKKRGAEVKCFGKVPKEIIYEKLKSLI